MFSSLTSKIERSLWSPEAESVASHHVKLNRGTSKEVNHIYGESLGRHIIYSEALTSKASLSANDRTVKMATCLRSGLKTSLPHLRRTTSAPLAAQALSQGQRRTKYTSYAETGGRDGTGKIGYDKFKQVDRREHKMPTQQSMKVSQKIQMRKNMPNDLGLLLGE